LAVQSATHKAHLAERDGYIGQPMIRLAELVPPAASQFQTREKVQTRGPAIIDCITWIIASEH